MSREKKEDEWNPEKVLSDALFRKGIPRDITPKLAHSHEPDSTTRAAASSLRSMFVALIQEGFSERQAMQIVTKAVSSSVQTAQEEDEES